MAEREGDKKARDGNPLRISHLPDNPLPGNHLALFVELHLTAASCPDLHPLRRPGHTFWAHVASTSVGHRCS